MKSVLIPSTDGNNGSAELLARAERNAHDVVQIWNRERTKDKQIKRHASKIRSVRNSNNARDDPRAKTEQNSRRSGDLMSTFEAKVKLVAQFIFRGMWNSVTERIIGIRLYFAESERLWRRRLINYVWRQTN